MQAHMPVGVALTDLFESNHERSRSAKQCLDKGFGFKGAQIVDAFTDADITNRQAELLGQGENHPALGGAVELSQCQAGQFAPSG